MRAAAFAAVFASGCAPAIVSLESLLAEGRRDTVKAFNAHEDERLRVRGKVVEVGLQEGVALEGTTNAGFGGWTTEVRQVHITYGMLVLVPLGADQGVLFCHVDSYYRDQLEGVKAGDTLVVDGTFARYRSVPSGLAVDMEYCTVER